MKHLEQREELLHSSSTPGKPNMHIQLEIKLTVLRSTYTHYNVKIFYNPTLTQIPHLFLLTRMTLPSQITLIQLLGHVP